MLGHPNQAHSRQRSPSHPQPLSLIPSLQALAGRTVPAATPMRVCLASRLDTQRAAAATLPLGPPAGARAPVGVPIWEPPATLAAPLKERAAAASGARAGPTAAADGELPGKQCVCMGRCCSVWGGGGVGGGGRVSRQVRTRLCLRPECKPLALLAAHPASLIPAAPARAGTNGQQSPATTSASHLRYAL